MHAVYDFVSQFFHFMIMYSIHFNLYFFLSFFLVKHQTRFFLVKFTHVLRQKAIETGGRMGKVVSINCSSFTDDNLSLSLHSLDPSSISPRMLLYYFAMQ